MLASDFTNETFINRTEMGIDEENDEVDVEYIKIMFTYWMEGVALPSVSIFGLLGKF